MSWLCIIWPGAILPGIISPGERIAVYKSLVVSGIRSGKLSGRRTKTGEESQQKDKLPRWPGTTALRVPEGRGDCRLRFLIGAIADRLPAMYGPADENVELKSHCSIIRLSAPVCRQTQLGRHGNRERAFENGFEITRVHSSIYTRHCLRIMRRTNAVIPPESED